MIDIVTVEMFWEFLSFFKSVPEFFFLKKKLPKMLIQMNHLLP